MHKDQLAQDHLPTLIMTADLYCTCIRSDILNVHKYYLGKVPTDPTL